ncbi:MAG TPA: hypothetical protein PLK69_07535 [Tetrasphaera sp.]|mgnify:CR=1 FL=1|nr:hypothetical protein [Tetrasphaera sp.]
MRQVARVARTSWPAALALALAIVLLGPALGPGLVLAYDLGWSPDPRFTPFVTGVGMVAPRAVPSDAVGVSLGLLLGAGLAQKVTLVVVLALCAAGPMYLLRALAPGASAVAVATAGVCGVWNPYVVERLAIGQWTILLGYGLVGFALRALVRWHEDNRRWPTVLTWVGVASLGGANTVIIVLAALVPALLWTLMRTRTAAALLAGVVFVGAAASAVWALPALRAARDVAVAATVFAPRSDTPFGVLLSLVSGGGMWNSASHPAARDLVIPALGATLLAVLGAASAIGAARSRPAARPLAAAAVVGLLVAGASVVPGVADRWSGLLSTLPGGGLLRDSHKFVASWQVLLALGLGFLVDRLGRLRVDGAWHPVAPVAQGGLLLLPAMLLPSAVWGLSARVQAVPVPVDYRATAAALSSAEPGLVGVLPWNQYRRYPWNGARTALSIAPRAVDQQVLQNDALPTRTGWVPGEDPVAARVSAAIAAGARPVAALRAVGVRYVLVEADATPGSTTLDADPDLAGTRVLAAGPSATAYDLGPTARAASGPSPGVIRTGWAITVATWLTVVVFDVTHRRARRVARGS